MKVIHGTWSDTKIKKFNFNKLGSTTFSNSTSYYYAMTSLIGVWFSSEKIAVYPNHFEYEINDDDFRCLSDNIDLVSLIESIIVNFYPQIDEYEMMDNFSKSKKIGKEVRQYLLDEGYTGIFIENDKEFGGSSWICFDLNCIK